jgi:O-antigen/teichoic acid export membrane protein
MSSIKTLLKQSSHYLTGRGIAIAIGFVSFPVFARLFSVADYGVLNLAQRCAMFAVAVAKLGMQNSILRFHEESASSEESLSRLYSTALFGTTFGALVCSTLCALFFALPSTSRWIPPNIVRALLVTCGLVFLRGAASPLYGFLRVEGRTLAFNTLDVLTRLLSLIIGVTMVLLLGRRPENLLLGLIVAEATVIVIALAFYVPRQRLSLAYFDRGLFRTALVFGAPLAASELAQTLLGSADRAFVQYYLGSQPLGYYAAACTIAIILQEALQIPLNLALVPIYMKIWYTEGAEATGRFVGLTFELFLLAACGVTAVVFAASTQLIIFVNSAKYAPAAPMLGPLVAGYMFLAASVFLSAGFWVQKKTMQMARLVAIACVVKCVLNVLLLPRLGLNGAVIPNVAGFMLLAGLYGWYSHRLLPIYVSVVRCLIYVAAGVGAAWVGQTVVLPGLLLPLAARATATLAVYLAAVLVLDSRARQWAGVGLSKLRKAQGPVL